MASEQQLLSGFGRTAPTRATVHTPDSLGAVVDRVGAPPARGIIARGLGRSYGDAAQNAGGDVLLCTDLDRVVEVDVAKGVATVEAGVSIDTLLRALLPLGWMPAVVPGTSNVTIGGAIASDIHGKFRHGSFADYVEQLQLVSPAGGVQNLEPGPPADAFWSTAGGMGLTGVITRATLRLQLVETAQIVGDTERTTDVDDCMARMLDGDHRYQYSVAWIDCLAGGGQLGRAVLSRGNHAALADVPEAERATARQYMSRTRLTYPSGLPNLINPLSVRAFNEMWYRKAPRARTGERMGIKPFFFPLDGVRAWNRVYGRAGLVQYQFVVPYGEEAVVRYALERLRAARTPTFLAVLKRFEHDSRSLLGFPMAGWTLAVDVPAARAGLAPLLDDLDERVASAGGRVYLTKDARVRPELLAVMYPQLARWRAARAQLDPRHVLWSDMDRRLDLTGREDRS